jgi:hypothetical protein
MLIGLVAMATMTALIGGGEEDDKGNNLWGIIPDEKKMKTLPLGIGGDLGYGTIQMPYGINFFSNIGYSIADVIRYNNSNGKNGKSPEEAATFLAKAFTLHLNPFGGMQIFEGGVASLQAISPAMIDPAIQIATNTNWTGRSMRPENVYDGAKEEATPFAISCPICFGALLAPSEFRGSVLISSSKIAFTEGEARRPLVAATIWYCLPSSTENVP